MENYAGRTITIFKDPITQKEREGSAELLEKLGDAEGLEMWKVHFLNDDPGATYDRLVKPELEPEP